MNIDQDILNEAIQYASFENMRKMEQTPKQQTPTLKPGDTKNFESYKTIKKKSGNFTEYLTIEEIHLIEEIINQQLHPCLGYNYFSK